MATTSGSGKENHSSKAAPAAGTAAAPPLNVYKQVAVIRRPSDSLTYEDADGHQKSVSIQELGDAIATATPLHTPKLKLDIPVPRINNVESYERDVPATFQVPLSYVRYHRRTAEEWNKTLQYVADWEDEVWLAHNTKFGGAVGLKRKGSKTKSDIASAEEEDNPAAAEKKGDEKSGTAPATTAAAALLQPRLSLKLFEQMMDLLETATGFDVIITTHQADQLFQAKVPQLYALFPNQHTKKAMASNSSGGNNTTVVTIKQVIHDVYNYWVQKRSKLKRPLLRRFWPVTSSDDTNPHLVFRPREKEKYKLRKKRQNDIHAYRKMKQLRDDFDNLRAVLELVRHREELQRQRVRLLTEQFDQRLYECVDTTGLPRETSGGLLEEDGADYEQAAPQHVSAAVPSYFDVQFGGRKRARVEPHSGGNAASAVTAAHSSAASFLAQRDHRAGSATAAAAPFTTGTGGTTNTSTTKLQVAGRNSGEPAPHFLHPLPTRESYAVSYQNATPHVATYSGGEGSQQGSHPPADPPNNSNVLRFRHRPRVGRGGRLCIDRVPLPQPDGSSSSTLQPPTVYTAGRPLPRATQPRERLLELLPRPLDHAALSRRIETISVAAIKEDFEAARAGEEENDGEEVVVPLPDWLETDDPVWGEERYAIGPI